jgi:hypothetical protein
MSFSRQDPFASRRQNPAILPPIASPAAGGNGPSITSVLRQLLDDPAADVRAHLIDPITRFLRSTHAEFAPTPVLLDLLNVPDVREHRDDPDLTRLETVPLPHLAGMALAATLPTAAAAVNLPADPRPPLAGMIIAALHAEPRKPRPIRPIRDDLADTLTTFREAAFDARSTEDPELSTLAYQVLQRVQVMRRHLLDSAWRYRTEAWDTLDEIVGGTYWPPDPLTLTRQDKRLRAYRTRRWRGIVGGGV